MIISNIILGINVSVDPSSSLNNVNIGDNVKISMRCNIYGSTESLVEIGENSTVGMNSIINGYSGSIKIGKSVSIAQNVIMMCDSGPNASNLMQKAYPIKKGNISIGDHTWIGAGAIIEPDVSIGRFCIVGANCFVTNSFPDYSIIGGTPARLLKTVDPKSLDIK
jgi:acetyltransferase-like isoleucine patch superfamily enzyme